MTTVMSQPAERTSSQSLAVVKEAASSSPFDHIGLRYGGPTQNTTATIMYWNELTRKSAVFSKLTMSSSSGSISGAVYLRARSSQPCDITVHQHCTHQSFERT